MKSTEGSDRHRDGAWGEVRRYGRVDWTPLDRFVWELGAARFMWTGEIEFEDGTLLHAYEEFASHR
jgi:hypothetical protein